jgi:adenylate kinase family enzyme
MNLGSRIMIMGSSGSGKSTMAMRLGEITGLPVVHLDELTSKAKSVDEMNEFVRLASSQTRWIIDGNYSGTRNDRLKRADTVVYLDYCRLICLWRALKRGNNNHGHKISRHKRGVGRSQKIDKRLISSIWSYPKKSREEVLVWLSKIEQPKQVFLLKGNREVKQFLKQARESDINTQL